MPSKTIIQFLSCLNNEDEDGGFWLPDIQREFVWSETQIERLFDSIMRNYPIGNFLIWRTKAESTRRKFIQEYHSKKNNIQDYLYPSTDRPKNLVLDGQQRLQSLFIGLKGWYDGKELYFNILSGTESPQKDIRYEFKFIDNTKSPVNFPYIKMKEIIYPSDGELNQVKIRNRIYTTTQQELDDSQKNLIDENIALIQQYFTSLDRSYEAIDSVNYPKRYSESDIVEIFIRANSGGTKLGKSDLLFSLLTASWKNAVSNVNELLRDLNVQGYDFSKDFIMKTCLTLLDMGSEYEVEKFRAPDIQQKFDENWKKMEDSIKDVVDYINGTLYIRSGKALPSHTPLIPLIYYRYKSGKPINSIDGVDDYLLKTLLTGAFTGHTDALIMRCINSIKRGNNTYEFNIGDLFEQLKKDNKSLTLSPDTIFSWHYDSQKDKPYMHLLFNLWYKKFNYTPTYSKNEPQVDHIFPRAELKKVKTINPENGRSVQKYRADDMNQFANLMLLSACENGPSNKRDKLPREWFADKDTEYFETHLIPQDPQLWEMGNYERFIEERKILILNKFRELHIII